MGRRLLSFQPYPSSPAIRVSEDNARTHRPLSFSQPHSRTPAVPIEEDHARPFEGVTQGSKIDFAQRGTTRLEFFDDDARNNDKARKLCVRDVEQRPSCAALSWRDGARGHFTIVRAAQAHCKLVVRHPTFRAWYCGWSLHSRL